VAKLGYEGDELVVRLSWLEKLGAFRGDVRVPRSSVRDVRATDQPWSELRGIRAPGTGWPGVIALGTRRGSGVRDFSAVYGKRPAAVVELEGAEFDRLVVSVHDVAEVTALRRRPDPGPPGRWPGERGPVPAGRHPGGDVRPCAAAGGRADDGNDKGGEP
jgi:hypothetical protein